jgi:hypothetical protein
VKILSLHENHSTINLVAEHPFTMHKLMSTLIKGGYSSTPACWTAFHGKLLCLDRGLPFSYIICTAAIQYSMVAALTKGNECTLNSQEEQNTAVCVARTPGDC